jgi:hypothetical protein
MIIIIIYIIIIVVVINFLYGFYLTLQASKDLVSGSPFPTGQMPCRSLGRPYLVT